MKFTKGQTPWNKGIKIDRDKFPNFGHFKKHTEKSNEKNRLAHLGKHFSPKTEFKRGELHSKFWLNKNLPEEMKKKISESRIGQHAREKNPNWKGGTYGTERHRIMGTAQYQNWRKEVFKRDDYRCFDCGEKGKYLEANHIYPFSQYPRLRFEINNGETLCVDCHLVKTKAQSRGDYKLIYN